MKGCIIILISRAVDFEIFDSNILSAIQDYKKILVINAELKNILKKIDYNCYDQVDFVSTESLKRGNYFISFYNVQELEKKLQLHCQEFSPEKTYIFSSDEFNLEAIADITKKLGAHGLDPKMSPIFRDKFLMKKFLREESKVNLPDFLLIDKSHDYQKISSILGKSFAVKPTGCAGAIGFHAIHNQSDWDSFVKSKYFHEYEYEAEVLLTGEIYHADSVRVDHKNIAVVICKYLFPTSEYIHSKPLGSILIKEQDEAYKDIFELNKNALEAFDVDGCFHLECFKLQNKPSVFLEVGWRQAGFPVLFNFNQIYNGFSQTLVHLFATIGHKIPKQKLSDYKELKFLLHKRKGVFKGLNLSGFKSKTKEKLLVKIGETMDDPKTIFDAVAEISLINDNYDELLEDFLRVRKVSLYK